MGSKSRRKHREETPSSPSSADDIDDGESETSEEEDRRRHRKDRRRGSSNSDRISRKEKERKRERKEEKRRKRRERKQNERERRKSRRKKKSRDYDDDDDDDDSSDSRSGSPGSGSDEERGQLPEAVVKEILKEFPSVGGDLKQLLQMIDDGQAVDIKGISEKALSKHLKKLFVSLNLKENGDRVFLLPSNARPTLEFVGHLIQPQMEPKEQELDQKDVNSISPTAECRKQSDDYNLLMPHPTDDAPGPRRRMVGPEMPSAELLAAAAKLTEAQAELREAELEEDTELFIGPPPPAVVAEAESANEAERFEEVNRIMDAEVDSPYDIVGVNNNMLAENIKKRYWKLSLLVHPDKCSHPQAHQAFIKLNKAFKDLQDPDKRKALDEKIKLKEEQEAFKVELKAMREAALWRRSQGLSMEGDDELLAQTEVKVAPTRDEWMTTLPPERKPGVSMHSTRRFSKSSVEGRGDTSAWTDTPSDRAQKAKMNEKEALMHLASHNSYLEAYSEAAAIASNEEEKKRTTADADLVDQYNKAKRSKSLVQKHQEEAMSHSKKKSKQKPAEKEEWVGNHPWKPWDREKDLVAGRQSIKFDADNMAQGLASKFSSGNFQRNFL